jgi:hypothetical protein
MLGLFFVQATGREAMVASFYHEGYEDPLLMLIRRRGVQAGLVIKVRVLMLKSFRILRSSVLRGMSFGFGYIEVTVMGLTLYCPCTQICQN